MSAALAERQAANLSALGRLVEGWGCGAYIERLTMLGSETLKAEMTCSDGSRWTLGATNCETFPWDSYSVRCCDWGSRNAGDWLEIDAVDAYDALMRADSRAEDIGWWKWQLVNGSGTAVGGIRSRDDEGSFEVPDEDLRRVDL